MNKYIDCFVPRVTGFSTRKCECHSFFLIMPEFDCSERRDLRDNAIFHLFLFFAQDVSEVTWGEKAF